MVLSSDIDLLHPPREVEQSKHKLKRLVQSPNSYFMDVKCQGCFNITTVFSHSQTVVTCTNCSTSCALQLEARLVSPKAAASGGRETKQILGSDAGSFSACTTACDDNIH